MTPELEGARQIPQGDRGRARPQVLQRVHRRWPEYSPTDRSCLRVDHSARGWYRRSTTMVGRSHTE
jgi:hypothetical protein